jgi:hypothetical protein
LKCAGYEVVNTVGWSAPLDEEIFAQVRTAFSAQFPLLGADEG